eukprot:PITA_28070
MANRNHNRISSIMDEEGQSHQSHEDIEVVLVKHFREIAKENFLVREPFIKDFTKHIHKLVSREDNCNLNRPITGKEVSEVLKEMQNGKAPVYKIISKVEANILKPLLPSLVSGEQTSYVEGRQILDSIIQAQKVVHLLTSNKKAGMIMQLDIDKAYDKVNWLYIKKVLIAFGFYHNWVRWIMALVTSSNFSILVNGSSSELFLPSRGLRQGDPLSPFLFILMMEGLGWSIKNARVMGKIQGL